MLRSLWSKIQQTSWFNRTSSSSISDEHHQPAYTLYHNDTSDIHIHSSPLESPSQSTLTYDRVTGHHRVVGQPLTRRGLAAVILTSFLAGLILGLTTRNNVPDVALTPPSNLGNYHPSSLQVKAHIC